MKRLLKISFALTLSAASVLAPALATAQSSGNGAASSGEGTTRDTNEPASGGQTGSMTNGDNAGEAGGQENAAANISVEQQNEIRSLIAADKAEPAAADVDIKVGVVVPESGVSLRALPARVAEIVPAYKNHQYFRLADGRIVIVAPGSRQAVYILKG